MRETVDAVVVLGGEFSPDRTQIGQGTKARLDAAINFAECNDVGKIIVAGRHPFRWKTPPPRPLAHLMKEYALDDREVPPDMLIVQDISLDTVGDALFTKTEATEPLGLRNLKIATSANHVDRGVAAFRHVMGDKYIIGGLSAGGTETIKNQRLQEFVGNTLLKAILGNTKPGDTESIRERLFTIVPGYSIDPVPTYRRLGCALSGYAAWQLAKAA